MRIDFASNNTIGGTTSAERNIISGNSGKGLYLISAGLAGNTIQGNYIGTDYGTSAIGNAIRSNSIFSNTDLGIDLEADGSDRERSRR